MELWLPWIKLTVVALVAFGFLWNFFRLKAPQGKAQSISKLVSGFVSVSLFLLVAWSAFLQGGKRNSVLVGSPDGTHVARIMITSGTIADSKYSSVIVRKVWSPTWKRAYYGSGYFQEGGPAEPYVHWADHTHLVIDYQHSEVEPSLCTNKVDNILVECRAHYW